MKPTVNVACPLCGYRLDLPFTSTPIPDAPPGEAHFEINPDLGPLRKHLAFTHRDSAHL
jgi:hypothetical protein